MASKRCLRSSIYLDIASSIIREDFCFVFSFLLVVQSSSIEFLVALFSCEGEKNFL